MKSKAAPSVERVIKRYDNRKLYDPAARRYVTLDDLARMVGEGTEVRVVDQKTGEDLTTTVLAQVVLEGIKQRTSRIPQQVLSRLVRLGSGPASAWREWTGPQEAAAKAREEAERIVSGLLGRGRLTLEEALALRQDIAQSVHKLVADAQKGLEGRLHGLLEAEREGGVVPTLQGLRERLMTFESYLGPRPRGRKGKAGRRRRKST